MRAPNSSGILATGAKPNVSKRSLTSDVATAFAMSPRQRSMMSLGVPAGATMPVSVSRSRSGMPASALVGTSGSDGERLALSTASPRNLPSLILAMAGGSAVNAIGVWPPMVELIANAALLKGTVTELILLLEQFAGEVGRRAGGRLGKTVFAGMTLHQLDKFLERLGGKAGIDRNDVGRGGDQRDRRKVFDRVMRDFRIDARIDHEARAHHEDRVAVGRRACHCGHAGVTAGAWNVFGVNLLPPDLRQFLRDDARDHVGRTAGPKGHDQSDRPCGISLRRGLAGGCQ